MWSVQVSRVRGSAVQKEASKDSITVGTTWGGAPRRKKNGGSKTSLPSKVEGRGCDFHLYCCKRMFFIDMDPHCAVSEECLSCELLCGLLSKSHPPGRWRITGERQKVTSPCPGGETSQSGKWGAMPIGLLCSSSLVTGF